MLNQATPEHFGTEFLSLKLAVKVVNDLTEALNHIATYSSKHSEAIISEDAANIARFLNEVDAAAVYANASTGFTDGAQFGLGAEIGISSKRRWANKGVIIDGKWLMEDLEWNNQLSTTNSFRLIIINVLSF
ncbi:Gamma-glutamyl phosphate reductase [compost metagenome]